MKLAIGFFLLLAAASTPAQAPVAAVHHRGVFGHVGHYVSTHKVLLAEDAAVLGSGIAQAYASVQCQHYPSCVEVGGAPGGRHPSAGETYAFKIGLDGLEIALNHTVCWLSAKDDPSMCRATLIYVVPLVIMEAKDAQHDFSVTPTWAHPRVKTVADDRAHLR